MRPLLYLVLTLLLAAGLRPRLAAAPLPPRRLPVGGQLAAGAAHGLLLRANGTLYAWGNNGYGQLGTGNNTDSFVPLAVASGNIPAGVRLVPVMNL